ncbi:hypothetical protein MM300_13985 [Evansella sp. LMS18]|uniref:hypothetical protein n=1 Tax=Evansella sp. LMS18 TaxID=2924033 RepID=UPI0020D1514B|nr:hypothetical protein [Evansella sp. LMS18]UTR09032.1 hypothetical protein MM300_13985 [Evansella sp. LMS18]
MSYLPPSFLGKKVFLEGSDQRFYVVKYEERQGKDKSNVLLFDQEAPVIFAVIANDGKFLDSFYLSNKTTKDALGALERFKKITERKKNHKVTQEDLRDALKPEKEAKMKNKNILKHLVDEHLEDIKNLWPSRLLTLQNTDGKSEDSLILTALEKALEKANGAKALQFLIQHRYDSFIPKLGMHVGTCPQLVKEVSDYYLSDNQTDIVEKFLYEAAKNVPVHNDEIIEDILNTARRIDHIYYSSVLRHVLSRLFKRVKEQTGESPKDWLKDTIHDEKLKRSIITSLKKKTG